MSKVYVSLESAMEMLIEDEADMIVVVNEKAHKVNSGGKHDE